MPEPETIAAMATDNNVNINWLWANQGDMRPLPATDPIARRILEVVDKLEDPERRLKVLEAAMLQQAALQVPAVAAGLREAQDAAKRHAEQPRRRMRSAR